MTRAEFNELGISEAEYKEMFGEEAIFDDEQTTAQAEPEVQAAEAEQTEVVAEEPAEETPVADIVPAAAEVVATGEAMNFKNLKAAAEFMAEKLNLKVTNTLDGLYKTIRRGTNKTHGYSVQRNDDKTVILTPIA